MKWLFYVIVVLYMFYRAVYGAKTKEVVSISVEPNLNYGDGKYFEAGKRKTISCKVSNKNQKVEWVNPNGDVVKRLPTERVFAQEHFVQTLRARIPALVLILTRALVEDTGVWVCRSGELTQDVPLCVIDPTEFVDTPTEVAVDLGRSITLSCQARGEPEPRLLWYRNGEVITDDDSSSKYKVMTKYNSQGFEGLLTVTSLESEDSGVYTCDAIQESTLVDGCTHTESLNITLHVNYGPVFDEGDDIKYVYGKTNENVSLVCSANGFPNPTYRWFKELDEILLEFSEHQFEFTADENQAILTLTANASTIGKRYLCRAVNPSGQSEQVFVVLKMEKPKKPSEVSVFNSTDNQIKLNVSWYEKIHFPIDGVTIQYIKMEQLIKKKVVAPREPDWKRGDEIKAEPDDKGEVATDSEDVFVTLQDLNEETEYWIRLRVTNEAGESPWSDPVLAATTVKLIEEPEQVDAVEEIKAASEEEVERSYSDATFYGIFFAGGIVVIAVVCMFAMRMV